MRKSIIQLLQSIIKALTVKPQIKGKLTREECFEILKPVCKRVELSDRWYYTTTKEEAKKFCEMSLLEQKPYIAESHDCDNFSFALNGYWNDSLLNFPFGYARSATHAFNIMIDNQKQVWLCEPQSNKWFKYENAKDKEFTPITLILI